VFRRGKLIIIACNKTDGRHLRGRLLSLGVRRRCPGTWSRLIIYLNNDSASMDCDYVM